MASVRAIITPSKLSGSIAAVASKSEAHRILICAALAGGTTDIDCSTSSSDIDATASCLCALGARVTRTRLGFRVVPIPRDAGDAYAPRLGRTLDCGESGSTLRFLLPVVCALGATTSLVGRGRLAERPLSPLYEELVAHGATLSPQGRFPLSVLGRLAPGRFALPGNVSSQYVSGLLMAAPILGGGVEVLVSDPVESLPYVTLTCAALRRFSVEVRVDRVDIDGGRAMRFVVPGGAAYATPRTLRVGGDWSNAAFWLCAGALSRDGITVDGLDLTSDQGDRAVLGALSLLGARVSRARDSVTVRPDHLHGCTIDVASCPDLVPPLAMVAARAEGTTRIVGAERLRLKESDRLETISAALNALGGHVSVTSAGLDVEGVSSLAGGIVDAANDHRIAMMSSVAALGAEGPTTIVGAECVSKSYPRFFDDLARLGGLVSEEE